ncbi:MAG: hypothetical protein WA731_11120 [Pseudonocardiaceae bacterium]
MTAQQRDLGFQTAAATIRWEADGDGLRIVTTDPETVAVLRRLVEQAGDTLTGDGPLAGPFIGLHRAIRAGVAHHKITPTSGSNRSSSPLRTCSLCIVAVQSRYASSCGR